MLLLFNVEYLINSLILNPQRPHRLFILGQLQTKFVNALKTALITQTLHKLHPHPSRINITGKVQRMHLNATPVAIVQSRSRADVQHPAISRPAVKHRKTHSIHSAMRNQLFLRINLNVCSRETESASHAEPADHHSVNAIFIAKNTIGALHITIKKQAPRLRRAKPASFTISEPLNASHHLDAKFIAPSHIIIKLRIPVMPEPVVIAHH